MWHDLTVADAVGVGDFYQQVIGWTSSPVAMGEYDEITMHLPNDEDVAAGVCHSRSPNAEIPAVWLVYVRIDDVKEACKKVVKLGGEVVVGPKKMDEGGFAYIQDPAGAYLALYQD
ncbi:MAG: VOC family protein [Fimbriimonadaceae bacterium]